MRRKRLHMPGLLARPSAIARGLGLGMLVASVVLLGLAADPALGAQGSSTNGEVPLIYWRQRSFKIPFNLSAAQKTRIKEVILLVSQDRGESWKPVSRTDAEHNAFSFRAKQDGEYWFTVQTRTTDGKFSPGLDSSVEPRMKIVIDTVPPTLVLEPEKRRGSTAGVQWEAKDEYLDLRSMVLEYQVEGVGVWNRVPITRPKLIGSRAWDAGTSEAVRVRMSVADRAGNLVDAVLNLPDGMGDPPEAAPAPPEHGGPPNIEQLSGTVPVPPQITAGQGFTPVDDEAPPSRPASAPPAPTAPARPRSTGGARNRARPTPSAWDRDPGSPGSPTGSATVAASASVSPGARSNAPPELFSTANPATTAEGGPGIVPAGAADGPGAPPATGAPAESARPAAAMTAQAAGSGASTLLVNSPRFKLQYAVDDAGPNGPATVELWITQDGGRTWIRRGDDPDRTSPIDVDLGGEGTYGISLVARSAAGLGDQPPAPGEAPRSWVEVDTSAPGVQLDPVQVGTGVNSGKIAITWRATDLHLAPRSVSVFWRPDQPGAPWQPMAEAQENTGRFIWVVPQSVPARFHVRVEAMDSVGHRGFSETTDTGPIMVDRSRPRSRIIGLDPNARGGTGSSAWPLR